MSPLPTRFALALSLLAGCTASKSKQAKPSAEGELREPAKVDEPEPEPDKPAPLPLATGRQDPLVATKLEAPAERAFLEAQDDADAITEDAWAEAKACDAGDWDLCRQLANRYEEGMGAPHDRARALGLYELGCAAGRPLHCELGGWLLIFHLDAMTRRSAAPLLDAACEGGQLHACALLARALLPENSAATERDAKRAEAARAKACTGGYAPACDRPPASPPQAPADAPRAGAVCPASLHWSASQSGGPRLHSGFDTLDPEAMLAALPEALDGYASDGRSSTPAGRAGTRTSSARASFRAGERVVEFSVLDRSPDCTLQPGTGAAMLAHGREQAGGRILEVDDRPALLSKPAPEGRSLHLWMGDRCQLTISASEGDADAFRERAESVALDELAKLCATRGGAGGLGALGR